jgi:hypothetical protein
VQRFNALKKIPADMTEKKIRPAKILYPLSLKFVQVVQKHNASFVIMPSSLCTTTFTEIDDLSEISTG